jgi:hypothetical protein
MREKQKRLKTRTSLKADGRKPHREPPNSNSLNRRKRANKKNKA